MNDEITLAAKLARISNDPALTDIDSGILKSAAVMLRERHDVKAALDTANKRIAELCDALKDMIAWFVDPGRALYDVRPEVYLAGSQPIVSKARAALEPKP